MYITNPDIDNFDTFLAGMIPNISYTESGWINKNSFKELVKYISKLNTENIINEHQFNELIALICANFIENEVELRIGKSLNNRFLKYF